MKTIKMLIVIIIYYILLINVVYAESFSDDYKYILSKSNDKKILNTYEKSPDSFYSANFWKYNFKNKDILISFINCFKLLHNNNLKWQSSLSYQMQYYYFLGKIYSELKMHEEAIKNYKNYLFYVFEYEKKDPNFWGSERHNSIVEMKYIVYDYFKNFNSLSRLSNESTYFEINKYWKENITQNEINKLNNEDNSIFTTKEKNKN